MVTVPISSVLRFGVAAAVTMLVCGAIILSEGTNPLETLRVICDASVGTDFGRAVGYPAGALTGSAARTRAGARR